MTTKIRIWKPLNSISGNYWFENLSLTNGNFIFVYRKEKQRNHKIHVICGGLPSFKYTDETYLGDFIYLDSLEEIRAIRPWCFYTVEDSEYLKKMSDDSGGLSDYPPGFKHYCIISDNEMIDLIYSSKVAPVVEIVIDGKVVESSDPGHHSLD